MAHIPNPAIKQNWTCKSCKFTSIVWLKSGEDVNHCPKCLKPQKDGLRTK